MLVKLTRWLAGAGKAEALSVDDPARYQRRKAAILHIDIVESTRRVRQDPLLAHLQIQHFYSRLQRIGRLHHAIARELRGDAAVLEFPTVIDAILAALAIHSIHDVMNISRLGRINPEIRTGISFGEVIGDDDMITGEAVIRAQRLEQMSEPGQVLVDQCAFDNRVATDKLVLNRLFTKTLKGFSEPINVYQAATLPDATECPLCPYFRSLAVNP